MPEEYKINDIYQGGYSSLDPAFGGFIGYRTLAGTLGVTTKPDTANQIQEVSRVLSTGAKTVEISAISPEIFEAIPQPHLKEINRIAKLTGVGITVHGPLVEPSGMTKEGFTEPGRESAERQMSLAVERSHEMSPKGNVPVTFHSSALLPGEVKPKGAKEVPEVLIINTETGSINKIPIKKRHLEEKEISVEKELDKINEESWNQNLNQLGYNTERASEFIRESALLAKAKEAEERAGKEISAAERQAEQLFVIGKNYLNSSYTELKNLFDIAYNKADKKEISVLNNLLNEIKSDVDKINDAPKAERNLELMQEVIQKGLKTFNKIAPPSIYKPLNAFAKEKTTTTFANVAYNSWEKFKDKAPIISVENPPVGGAFATGEELKTLIEESRKKFVEKAVQEGKMSEFQAKEQAEKLLGVTWDVGHINMLRKYGYEAADIVKETEKVAPLVKHVHMSDNFGFEHTELPMGMGNVPTKEMMEKLGKKAEEVKKIIEAGSWYRSFGQTPPFQESLEAFGSSIYYMKMAPYWNQSVGLQEGYFGGYGQMLPPVHYETFGTGFMAQLPQELGGQMPGARGGRMSGRPME
jgi:sugar phosphate isomerase/epimerase